MWSTTFQLFIAAMEGSIKVNIPPVSLKVSTVSIFLRLCDSIAYLVMAPVLSFIVKNSIWFMNWLFVMLMT